MNRGCPYVFRQAAGGALGCRRAAWRTERRSAPFERDERVVMTLAVLDLARVIGPRDNVAREFRIR